MRQALPWRLPLLVLGLGALAAVSIAGCGPALTVGAIAGISSLEDDDSDRPDALPSASVTTPSGTVNDVIALSYRLTDADGDRASIVVEYSRDGATFQSASQAFVEGAEGTSNLTAAPGGSDHVFFWNSTRDLSTENVDGVSLRVRPLASSGAAGVEATTGSFDVFNRFVTTLAAQPSTARVRVTGISRESNGDLVLADSNGHRVLRYSLSGGTTDVLAGTGASGFVGGGIAGEQAQLNLPRAVAVRPSGELLVADFFNLRLRQIDQDEFISELAGGGNLFGENDLGSESFLLPSDVDVDSSGNAYLLSDNRVRVLNLSASDLSFAKGTTTCQQLAQLSALTVGPSRVYSVFAGAPGCGTGDSAYTARLFDPLAIALQSGGSGERILYVLDRGLSGGASNNQFPVIRAANLGSSAVSVRSLVTKTALTIQPGDQQVVANNLQLPQIAGELVDLSLVSAGVLLLPSSVEDRVFAINLTTSAVELAGVTVPAESVTAVAGSGTQGFEGDGRDALAARLVGPVAAASDGQGSVFVSEGVGRVRVFAGASGFATPSLTLAPGKTGTIPAVLPGASPALVSPMFVTRAPGGDLLIADNELGDSRSNRVTRLSASAGELSLILGGGSFGDGGDGGPAGLARLGLIGRPDISSDGGLVVVPDRTHNRVRAVNLGQQARTFLDVTIQPGEVETVVGVAQVGSASGDGGPASQASLSGPVGCSFDGRGLLWISDQGNHRVRVANPLGVSVEVLGVTIPAGQIQTVIGTGAVGTPSDDGDGGAAGAAKLERPAGLIGPDGNFYLADGAGQPRVRVVNLNAQAVSLGGVSVAPGAIETIAFSGARREPDQSNLGDGGNALAATLRQISGLDVSPGGLLYVSDGLDHRVRVVNLSDQAQELGSLTLAVGAVATALGDGIPGFSGDPSNVARDLQGGPPGLIDSPAALLVNDERSLFLLDAGNGALRLANFGSSSVGFAGVTAAAGQLVVVNGSRSGSVRAEVPQSVVVDSQNLVIFSDSGRIGDNPSVLQLDPDTRIVTRLAGTGERTSPDGSDLGDDGRALLATLSDPQGVALDSEGSLYICDAGNQRIRFVNRTANDVQPLTGVRVRPGDIVTLFNGQGDGDEGNDVGAAISNGGVDMLFPVALARQGEALWVCDEGGEKLLRLDLSAGTVAGVLSETLVQSPRSGTIQNDGMGRVALSDAGLTFASGPIRVGDTVEFGNNEAEVLEIDAAMDRLILADDNPPATPQAVTYRVVREFEPTAVAPLSATEAYVGVEFDGFAEVVRVTDQGGGSFSLSSVAGTTSGSWNGDRLVATNMNFAEVGALSRDGDLLYVADPGLNRVVVINTGGSTQTIAGLAVGAGEARTLCGGGQGRGGFNGDALPPEIALLLRPTGVAPTPDGKLVIADQGNARLRSFLR